MFDTYHQDTSHVIKLIPNTGTETLKTYHGHSLRLGLVIKLIPNTGTETDNIF